jgi:bifunctional non-homologous end joining protein LigD
MIPLSQLYELIEVLKYPGITPNQKINNQFVIQEHKADRAGLHWDVRLGHNGVLVSWATKKLPDLINTNSKKIMLFQTPDHDSSWINFAGKIEDGYGAGEVNIYDTGNYELLSWKDDHITVVFYGNKIKGKYTFVLYPDKKSKETQWLFFKSK